MLDFLAIKAMGKIPEIRRNLPSNDNSPKNKFSCEFKKVGICSEAAKIPTAIAKSKAGPDFGKSAGAKFTVNRRSAILADEFLIAARTRSFDSSTALSGKPTILKAGKPEEISASTSIGKASSPTTDAAKIFATAIFSPNLLALFYLNYILPQI